jgi:hypothetical protein
MQPPSVPIIFNPQIDRQLNCAYSAGHVCDETGFGFLYKL